MTDKTNEANESVKKIPRKRPKWNIYKKMRRLTLHEGIALTYNISPPHMSILIEDDEELLNKYCTRLKMARRECSDKGSIEVIERGQEKDGSDWTVTTDSFLRFVEEMDWKVKDDFNRPLKFVRILIPRSFSFRPMVAAVVEFAVGTMHSGVIAPYSTLFALCGGYAAMRFRKRIML